jgi:DNA-binding PadR family transcriptional regulator
MHPHHRHHRWHHEAAGCDHPAEGYWFMRHRGHFFGQGGHGRWGGEGMGGHGFRGSRIFTSTDLQLLIVALLAEKPRHGYELIKALEELSKGFYAPSPGVIYPALSYLEEIGHADVEAEGNKKLYRLTDAGRAFLAENRESADIMLAELARVGEKMADARRYYSGSADNEAYRGGAAYSAMRAAGRNLRAAIEEKREAPAEEQRRIVEIINRAAKEIRGQ